jgi:hypothetical protein
MVVHSCNPSTQEDLEFKASLHYIARPWFQKKKKKKVSN